MLNSKEIVKTVILNRGDIRDEEPDIESSIVKSFFGISTFLVLYASLKNN